MNEGQISFFNFNFITKKFLVQCLLCDRPIYDYKIITRTVTFFFFQLPVHVGITLQLMWIMSDQVIAHCVFKQ